MRKWLTVFNILPYLTFLLLATCEDKTVNVHNLKMYTDGGYIPLVIFLGAKSLLIFSFKPGPLYLRFPLFRKLYKLQYPICMLRERGKSLLGIESSVLGFTTCSLRTMLTVLSWLPLLALSCFIQ